MEITAALVKELRERTGAGMMDCKRALQEADGDIEVAIESMRMSGMAKAARKAGRVAAEGAIVLRQAGSAAVLVEVNSETDFVAKDANFLAFADAVAETVMTAGPTDVAALLETALAGQDVTVEEARQQLVAKLGENISVRRFSRIDTGTGSPGAYVHGGRIGVLVDLSGGDAELAKDLAMHIAASNPVCVSESEVDGKLLERERKIYAAQAGETGKPPEIVEKMVQGRLQKFLKEITLLGQPFVKDTEQTVGKLLKDKGAEVRSFVRLEVGEGIEKKSDNFAEEVMAQARRD